MIMPILPEWKSFELYLDALNSKFRTKAKASIHRSSEVKIESWDARKIRENLPFISELYHAVYDRADFRLGKLKADQFVFMKEELGDDFIFRAYTFDGLLVGFATAFAHDHVLDAHLIGINYDLNKKLGIYSRMLYDYIELAIATQSTQLVFGRTAGEIKSAAGALPVDLKCCIRHPGRISNVLLTLLFSYVRPSEFALRQPYKKETLASIAEHFSHLRVGPSILSNL